jgi:DNA-binding CsgD family transcriptional regulator/tetratricopeptide (TPR) repeat protein
LEVELDNFRAALVWSQTLPLQDDVSRPDVGLRLAGALTWFAHFGNHVNEARGWLVAALQRAAAARGFPGHSATVVQAKALWGAGLLAVIQGDYQIACAQLEESVALWRTLGDPCGLAAALRELGYVALFQGHFLAAHRYTVESVTLFRGAGNRWELALSLHNLGVTLTKQGDHTTALVSFEECLSLYRDLNDAWGISTALAGLGFVCGQRGDYTSARVRLEEALAIWRAKEDKWSKTEALTLLGEVIQRQGEPKQASDVYLECLVLTREVGDKAHSALVLRHLGSVAQSLRQYDRAVRLFAAAAIWDTASGDIFKTLVDPAEHERELAAVRTVIGEEAFSTNWTAGQALTLDQAIEYILVVAEAPEPAPARVEHNPVVSFPSAYPAGLTAREVEVLRLLALDHSYAQIAERLVISRRTVNAHLTSIYSKLGVTSRAEATRFAIDHRLA